MTEEDKEFSDMLYKKLKEGHVVTDGKKRLLMALQLWLSKYTCEEDSDEQT